MKLSSSIIAMKVYLIHQDASLKRKQKNPVLLMAMLWIIRLCFQLCPFVLCLTVWIRWKSVIVLIHANSYTCQN